ncbi:unnamed protein product, partial [Polarella glacialis]
MSHNRDLYSTIYPSSRYDRRPEDDRLPRRRRSEERPASRVPRPRSRSRRRREASLQRERERKERAEREQQRELQEREKAEKRPSERLQVTGFSGEDITAERLE